MRGAWAVVGVCIVLVANWILALWLWPGLPERIPIHFDGAGRADGWAAKSPIAWFALPALGTVIGGLFAFALPRWMVALAAKNSAFLNVPNKKAFSQLPVEARVRAVGATANGLLVLAVVIQFVLGWIVFGSARVAAGDWQTLPPVPSYVLIGGVIACAFGLAIQAHRAVKRELAAARGAH